MDILDFFLWFGDLDWRKWWYPVLMLIFLGGAAAGYFIVGGGPGIGIVAGGVVLAFGTYLMWCWATNNDL